MYRPERDGVALKSWDEAVVPVAVYEDATEQIREGQGVSDALTDVWDMRNRFHCGKGWRGEERSKSKKEDNCSGIHLKRVHVLFAQKRVHVPFASTQPNLLFEQLLSNDRGTHNEMLAIQMLRFL